MGVNGEAEFKIYRKTAGKVIVIHILNQVYAKKIATFDDLVGSWTFNYNK